MEVNIDNDITKIKIYRLKCCKFKSEQINITKKLFNILNITETNKMFTKYDLDHNPIIQSQIIDLLSDIKSFFTTNNWHYFYKNSKKNTDNLEKTNNETNNETNISLLSLVRQLFKDMKIELAPTTKVLLINKKRQRYTIYNILSDISDFV